MFILNQQKCKKDEENYEDIRHLCVITQGKNYIIRNTKITCYKNFALKI